MHGRDDTQKILVDISRSAVGKVGAHDDVLLTERGGEGIEQGAVGKFEA